MEPTKFDHNHPGEVTNVVRHLIESHSAVARGNEALQGKSVAELRTWHDELHATPGVLAAPDLVAGMAQTAKNVNKAFGGLADAMNRAAYGSEAAERLAKIRLERAELALARDRRRDRRDRLAVAATVIVGACFALFLCAVLIVAIGAL